MLCVSPPPPPAEKTKLDYWLPCGILVPFGRSGDLGLVIVLELNIGMGRGRSGIEVRIREFRVVTAL